MAKKTKQKVIELLAKKGVIVGWYDYSYKDLCLLLDGDTTDWDKSNG